MDPNLGLFPIPVDVRTEIIKARKIRKQKKTKNRVGRISIEHHIFSFARKMPSKKSIQLIFNKSALTVFEHTVFQMRNLVPAHESK